MSRLRHVRALSRPLVRAWSRLGARLRRDGVDAAQVRACGARIAHERAVLLRFGEHSDHEFTELARRLAGVTATLGEVRRGAGGLERVVSGQDDEQAMSSANAMHQSCVDLVNASIGVAAAEGGQIEAVETALHGIGGSQRDFKHNSIMYRLLAMGIRMEAARLDPQEQVTFFNVASAIADIELQMTETTDRAFNQIADVVREATAERAKLRALHAALHRRAYSSLETIQRELDLVRQSLEPCAVQSRALGAGLAATTAQVGQVTTALQFQDIVRQKLQHVAHGFEDLAAHLTDDDHERRGIDTAYVHRAAHLQLTQLAAARAEIERAAGTVVDGMHTLIETTQELVAQFEGMHETAGAALRHCRVATLVETEVGKLSEVIAQTRQNHRTIGQLVDRIETVVNVFARDVGAHQFEVLLVSLNAQIAAARVSSADALNKLAEEAIRLSAENAILTGRLAQDLAGTLDQLARVKTDAAEFLARVTRGQADLEKGCQTVTAKLQRLVDGIQAEASGVHRNFANLHGQVSQLIRGLSFPDEISATWTGAETLATELAALTVGARGSELHAHSVALLDAHRQRYTMLAEHDAHDEAVGGPSSDPKPEPPLATAVAKSSEFGDGIELF